MITFDEVELIIFNNFSISELQNFCDFWKVGVIIENGKIIGLEN